MRPMGFVVAILKVLSPEPPPHQSKPHKATSEKKKGRGELFKRVAGPRRRAPGR
jgi:hypothetical protein